MFRKFTGIEYIENKVGTIIRSISNPGRGWLECDGRSLLRSQYPKLEKTLPKPGLKVTTTDISEQLVLINGLELRTNLLATDTTMFYTFATSGIYYRSTDNGITWTYHHTPFNLNYRTLYKLSTGRLILASSRESVPIYSDDDGLTWQASTGMPVLPPLCMYCISNDVLYMIKQGNTNLYKSADLINWTTIPLNINNWRQYSGYLWSSIIPIYDSASEDNDFIITVSDSDFGLYIYLYNGNIASYENLIKSKYLGFYDTPSDALIINNMIDEQTYKTIYYHDVRNNSINMYDGYLYRSKTIAHIDNLHPDIRIQSANDILVAFSGKDITYSSYGVDCFPNICYDKYHFNYNYGISLPVNSYCNASINNKIYYINHIGDNYPNYFTNNRRLVTLEFDPLLFNLPGIKPDCDVKYYINTGQ